MHTTTITEQGNKAHGSSSMLHGVYQLRCFNSDNKQR